ncbi:MAG: hypothetical protein US89_C0005G0108 [Candidatus Peregrinibacteria bacterium GW2011_GWF2_38_29]|nr:MAG: hypothetical protein US89_C0005G0108 [Candidatus Peregrinibacteria bacterium GW2011_GWF2_38_29]HBB02695.1 hypothetical protein [Candidatus Peregrinibacteria bacterium]
MDANNLMQTPAQVPPQMPEIAPEENKSSWKKIVAVLAIILVIGGGAYYYYSAGQQSEDLKGLGVRGIDVTAPTTSDVTATRIIDSATESKVGTALDNTAAAIESATRVAETATPATAAPVVDDGSKVVSRVCEGLKTQLRSAMATRDMAQAKADGVSLMRKWFQEKCGTLPADIQASWDAVLAYKEPVIVTISKCDQLLASFRTMLFGSTDKNAMRIAGTPMVAELTTNKCTIPGDLQAKWDEVKNSYAMTAPTAAQCKTATDGLMAKIKAGDLVAAENLKPRVEKLGCAIPADVQAALDNLINNIKNPLITPVDVCTEGVNNLRALVNAKDKAGAEALYNKLTRAATKPCIIPAVLEASYQNLIKPEVTVAVDICPAKTASFQGLLDMGAQVSKTRLEAAYTSLKAECAKSVTAAMENTYAQLMAAGEVVTEVVDEEPATEPVTEPVVDDQEAICAQKIGKFDNAVNQGIISLADVLYNQIAGKCMISQDSMDLYNALKSGDNSGDGGYVYNGGSGSSGSSDASTGLGGGSVSTGSGTGGSALITVTEDGSADTSTSSNIDMVSGNALPSWGLENGFDSVGGSDIGADSVGASNQGDDSQIQSVKTTPKNLGANVFVPQPKVNTKGMKRSAGTGPEAVLYLVFAAMSYGATVITRRK